MLTLSESNHDPSNIIAMDEREWRDSGYFFRHVASHYRDPLVTLNDAAINKVSSLVLIATSLDETITEHGWFHNASHGNENLKT